jgi:predicted phosphodiesterase
MRIVVISDVHANLVALRAVLKASDELQPDALWCLGDVAGYGPEPQACIEGVQEAASLCLAGNHDLAVLGRLPLADFSADARAAAAWQQGRLDAEALDWLGRLPSLTEEAGVTLTHGSPRGPVWEYVTNEGAATANAAYFDTPLCLIGHSHLAIAWQLEASHRRQRAALVRLSPGETLDLSGQKRWLLNPGSVGQPRDGDPRASYALLDTGALTWTWYRQDYDIAAVERAIRAAGLPPRLGQRLYAGW